mmetsp:Transcript_36695/g.114584  ORF Transcript_36695/g.114584 Transcript_36695/m.114584 type:complete len:84 (-) Transcript_36695:2076-2327(-)
MSVNSQPVTSEMADHFQRRENEEQSASQLPTRSNLTERLIQRDQSEPPDDVERGTTERERAAKRDQREKISEEARRMAKSVFG